MKNLDIITQIAIAEILANKGLLFGAAEELQETAESGKPFAIQTPNGVAFGIKKDSEHPIAQFLRSLEQEVKSQTEEQKGEPCECDDCNIFAMLMEAADTVVQQGVGASINSNHPNLEEHLAALLALRDDIEVGRHPISGEFAIVPASFAENHKCSCGNCNRRANHKESEHSSEQPVTSEANQSEEQPVVVNQPQMAASPQELVQQAVESEILARYPDAKSADKGLSVGDVIICHPSVPSILVTPDNIMELSHKTGYFVVAHVDNV